MANPVAILGLHGFSYCSGRKLFNRGCRMGGYGHLHHSDDLDDGSCMPGSKYKFGSGFYSYLAWHLDCCNSMCGSEGLRFAVASGRDSGGFAGGSWSLGRANDNCFLPVVGAGGFTGNGAQVYRQLDSASAKAS